MYIYSTQEGEGGEYDVAFPSFPLIFTDLESRQPDTVQCSLAWSVLVSDLHSFRKEPSRDRKTVLSVQILRNFQDDGMYRRL